MTHRQSLTRAARKPKFRVGQVVAVWRNGGNTPLYFRVASWHFGQAGEIRYRFAAHGDYGKDYDAVEEILTPLTKQERGQ